MQSRCFFMKRIFIQTHNSVAFFFRQTADDFIVDELPLKRGPERGNYLHLKVRKQNLSTIEMIAALQEHTQCFTIGYAGLKDKSATTTQYLSVPLKFSRALKSFNHPRITFLESFRQSTKINMGDLEGNRFFIRLKEVTPESAQHIQDVLDGIMRHGMPNYFGYQRFGRQSGNFEKTRDVAHGESGMKDTKMHRLLGNAYQSYLFNDWLAERVTMSKKIAGMDVAAVMGAYGLSEPEASQLKTQPGIFRVLPGDIMLDVKAQKWVNVTDLQAVRKPYKERKLIPTGLLAGRKAWRAKALAGKVESAFDDAAVVTSGDRRPAWVYPSQIESEYKPAEGFFELSFTLPKGAYATVLLENLANRDLGPESAPNQRGFKKAP